MGSSETRAAAAPWLTGVSSMEPKDQERSLQSGLSLLELLVAVSVAVVLAGIAAPLIPAQYRQYQLSAAAQQVAGDLTRARMKAIGESAAHRLSLGSTSYYMESASGTGYQTEGGTVSLPKGTSLQSAPSNIEFNPIGLLLAASTVNVVVTNGERSKTVTVSELGRVTIQ
jgi:prepilin-type N-terminal cleavage/methylation domain-containing protein